MEVTSEEVLSVKIDQSWAVLKANEEREFTASVGDYCGEKITPNFVWEYNGLEEGEEEDLPDGINPEDLLG